MYENPYMGNPYMQNRYYGQQYQPVQQQTIQQPVAQLVGRPVDTQESIQASDVPMNMPYAFPFLVCHRQHRETVPRWTPLRAFRLKFVGIFFQHFRYTLRKYIAADCNVHTLPVFG